MPAGQPVPAGRHGPTVGENGGVLTIPDPGFAGDDGSTAPEVAAALAAHAADPTHAAYPAALAALSTSRVLVPVVAMLGEVEYDEKGLAHDKTSDMATVLLTGADGRLALLGFTGTDSLTAWNPEARPVPVPARVAAQSAIQDGADALVVDIAGPALFVVEGDDLTALAQGLTLARVGDSYGWISSAEE